LLGSVISGIPSYVSNSLGKRRCLSHILHHCIAASTVAVGLKNEHVQWIQQQPGHVKTKTHRLLLSTQSRDSTANNWLHTSAQRFQQSSTSIMANFTSVDVVGDRRSLKAQSQCAGFPLSALTSGNWGPQSSPYKWI
jgi:hypothetical protein